MGNNCCIKCYIWHCVSNHLPSVSCLRTLIMKTREFAFATRQTNVRNHRAVPFETIFVNSSLKYIPIKIFAKYRIIRILGIALQQEARLALVFRLELVCFNVSWFWRDIAKASMTVFTRRKGGQDLNLPVLQGFVNF